MSNKNNYHTSDASAQSGSEEYAENIENKNKIKTKFVTDAFIIICRNFSK